MNIVIKKFKFSLMIVILLYSQLGRENQRDINYDITLTLLPCPDAKLHTRTKDNWFNATISGASYNATIVAFNQAENTPPWSLLINEDEDESKYSIIVFVFLT